MPKKKTLKTYLKTYARELSGSESYRLLEMAEKLKEEPRCEGPVLLYAAMFLPKERWFISKLNGDQRKNYEKTLQCLEKCPGKEDLIRHLPHEQSKALKSYYDYCDEGKADSRLKKAYFRRISDLLSRSSLSKYRICKDNRINQGNFFSFLNGKLDSLSLEKCEEVYQYLSH